MMTINEIIKILKKEDAYYWVMCSTGETVYWYEKDHFRMRTEIYGHYPEQSRATRESFVRKEIRHALDRSDIYECGFGFEPM